MKKAKCGQGTLEYVIIFAAVVGVMVFVAGWVNDKISNNPGGSYKHLRDQMADKLTIKIVP